MLGWTNQETIVGKDFAHIFKNYSFHRERKAGQAKSQSSPVAAASLPQSSAWSGIH